MKLNPAISLVVCLLLTSPALSADKDELQGTWVCESFIKKGEKKDRAKGIRFTFSGDKFTMSKTDSGVTRIYKADAGKSPKQITIIYPTKGTRAPGIYKIDRDTLTICMPYPDSPSRPTAFDNKQGGLFVLKRKKD